MKKQAKIKGIKVTRRYDDSVGETISLHARATSESATRITSANSASEETLGFTSAAIARELAQSGKVDQIARLSKASQEAATSASLTTTTMNYVRAAGLLGSPSSSNRSAAEEALGLSAASMARELAKSGKVGQPARLSKAAQEAATSMGLTSTTMRMLDLYSSPARDALDQIASTSRPPAYSNLLNDFHKREHGIEHTTDPLPPKRIESNTMGDITAPPALDAAVKAITSTADIGHRIREARRAMGMTQQRFADLAGVGRRFLGELERGKASLEFGRVLSVCEAAGIKLGFLS